MHGCRKAQLLQRFSGMREAMQGQHAEQGVLPAPAACSAPPSSMNCQSHQKLQCRAMLQQALVPASQGSHVCRPQYRCDSRREACQPLQRKYCSKLSAASCADLTGGL